MSGDMEWFVSRLAKPLPIADLPYALRATRAAMDEIHTDVHRSIHMAALMWSVLDEIGRRPFFGVAGTHAEMVGAWVGAHAQLCGVVSTHAWEGISFIAALQQALDEDPQMAAMGLKAVDVMQGCALHAAPCAIVAKSAMRECFRTGKVYVNDGQQIRRVDPLRQPGGVAAVYVPLATAMARLRELVR